MAEVDADAMMAEPMTELATNVLYYGDNLDILRQFVERARGLGVDLDMGVRSATLRRRREGAYLTNPDSTGSVPFVQLRLTGTLGRRLESPGSQREDVAFASNAMKRYRENRDDDLARVALFWSGVVIYCRAFIGGRRETLDASAVVAPENQAAHQRLMDLRNQRIAHQVSVAEQIRAVALLTPLELEPKAVVGTSVFSIRMIGPSGSDLDALIACIDQVGVAIEGLMDDADQRAREALATVNLDELYKRALVGHSAAIDS